ncbi:MAG: 50S ribosomal protein L5 [Chloroflexi bacterium]|nr:50S ribosomal protein L5 [Chloroflexota bacterium]
MVTTQNAGAQAKAQLRQRYQDEIHGQLTREFSYANPMQVPTLRKIAINIGLGEALDNGRAIDSATADLMAITGQKPVVTRAKRAISNFRLREGNAIGLQLTLRGERMWEFYERLVHIALPRVRDFRGVSPNSFDGRGNYSLGITEQVIFPEVSFETIEKVRGLQINVITSANTDEEGKRLIELLGMPFTRTE